MLKTRSFLLSVFGNLVWCLRASLSLQGSRLLASSHLSTDFDASSPTVQSRPQIVPSYCPDIIVTMGDLVDSMLDLLRRLPPTQIEENVSALVQICPDYADDLLGSVDQPLKLKVDKATGKEYLACDYNRDGESYRYLSFRRSCCDIVALRDGTNGTQDHHGRTSMIRHLMMAPFRRPNFASWRLRPTSRSTPTAKCTYFAVHISDSVRFTIVLQVLRGRCVFGVPVGPRRRWLRRRCAPEEE